ncbi:MAG: ChaN family lipoprotein, partial [Deltaproteobacteria bacterium]|nr:ChaN family lipoprotein [Deltaproteobacteria bacterium]
GKLDQKAFLEKTHWYANWKFNYGLYANILEFLKNKKIRLIGLNIPFHIPSKISVGGIENLSYNEKKYLPKQLNTSNPDHRAYVEEIFKNHHIRGRENFEYFYMTQCVWEDTMAESIDRALKENIMIVLVGNGHIIHKFGIPDRAYKLTNKSFRTVFLAPAGTKTELLCGDYIWVTPANKKITMKKFLKSRANRHMMHNH